MRTSFDQFINTIVGIFFLRIVLINWSDSFSRWHLHAMQRQGLFSSLRDMQNWSFKLSGAHYSFEYTDGKLLLIDVTVAWNSV